MPALLRLGGLIASCDHVQQLLNSLMMNPAANERERVSQRIKDLVRSVDDLCAQHTVGPSSLPTPSRRAYQWLSYLSDPDAFTEHLDTLIRAAAILRGDARLAAQSQAGRMARFELDFSSHIWRIRPTSRAIHMSVAEGYSGAPDEVLRALVTLMTTQSQQAKDMARAYAYSDDFAEIMLAMEFTIGDDDGAPRGVYHDLDEVFTRVNHAHWGGALARPRRLVWSSRITSRVMGYYQSRSDTVMLSRTLDAPAVAAHVLKFVMYHELLHKQLGVRVINGRRHAHFPEFRAAERRFPGFAEATQALNALALRSRSADA